MSFAVGPTSFLSDSRVTCRMGRQGCCDPEGFYSTASLSLSALQITVLWNVGTGRLVGTSLYCVDVGFAEK